MRKVKKVALKMRPGWWLRVSFFMMKFGVRVRSDFWIKIGVGFEILKQVQDDKFIFYFC